MVSMHFLVWSTLIFTVAVNGIPRAASAAALPELGDSSSAIVSPDMERRIGEMFLKQLRAQLPTTNDEILKYYVATHLYQLAQHSQIKETVLSSVLINNEEINAFAAPGGVVGINLGLFIQAQDVHEYSSVIAHELAHLSQRHFARGVETQQRASLTMLVGALATALLAATVGSDAAMAAMAGTQAAIEQNQLRYSRTNEQEADRIGLNTLVNARMDPHGMTRMFTRMQRAFRFDNRAPEFLLSHPVTESRITDARNQAAAYPHGKISDSRDFQFMRARAQIYSAETPTQALAEARNASISRDARVYRIALAQSGIGEHRKALDTMKALHKKTPRSILLTASYAEIMIKAGHNREAIDLLSHQLVINPDNQPFAMLYAKALSNEKRHVDAQEVLTRQARVYPNDIDIWHNLAETAGLAGDVIRVHRARAEFFSLHGSYEDAIQHLEYARRLVRGGNYQLIAQLTQRIQDLRSEIEAVKG